MIIVNDYFETENEKISFITIEDLEIVVALHEEYLNYGEGVRSHYSSVLRDPDTVALKYTVSGETAGLFIYTKGVALSAGHDHLVKVLEEKSRGRKVYTGDAVLVKREYRKRGVADKLCVAMLRELKKRDSERMVHEFWVHPDGCVPARRMFRVFEKGFYLGHFLYFYRDFHQYGYFCPICGENCICSAEIYLADMPGGVGIEN